MMCLRVDSQTVPTGIEQVQHFHNAYEMFAEGVKQALAERERANAAAQAESIENQPEASENKTKMQTDWQKKANRLAYDNVIAGPAGNIAITPGLPMPLRLIAGALYAPKLIGDIEQVALQDPEITPEIENELKQNPGSGPQGLAIDSGKQVQRGRVGNVFQKIINDPIEEPAKRLINNPKQFVSDIYHDPTKLWPDVLLPGNVAHGVAKPGIHLARDVVKDTVNKKSAAEKSGALSLEQKLDNAAKIQDLDAMSNVADALEEQGSKAKAQRSGEAAMETPDEGQGLKVVVREGFKDRPLDKKIVTGTVDENEALIIKQKTGRDISPGYTHTVGSYEVRHSRKGHAVESDIQRGHIPLGEGDYL